MQPWNEAYGITLLAFGINSETNGSQENDLPVRDLTPLSRPFSNLLILWSRLLQECMQKCSLQQWVSTSAVFGPSNITGLSSGCYGISEKHGGFQRKVWGFSREITWKSLESVITSKLFHVIRNSLECMPVKNEGEEPLTATGEVIARGTGMSPHRADASLMTIDILIFQGVGGSSMWDQPKSPHFRLQLLSLYWNLTLIQENTAVLFYDSANFSSFLGIRDCIVAGNIIK